MEKRRQEIVELVKRESEISFRRVKTAFPRGFGSYASKGPEIPGFHSADYPYPRRSQVVARSNWDCG